MKKFLFVLMLACVLALISSPAFATGEAARGIQTSDPVEADTAAVLTGPVWVYGISIYADAAASFAGIYNGDPTDGSIKAEDEIGEATQYETTTKWYAKPVWYSGDVGVLMTTGVFFIYYGAEGLLN
jgi:hypothetical protein